MDDKELVEVWRKEFESTIDKPHLLHRFPSGTYSWESTEWMWAGFQRAKRSQPVIELPEILYEWDMERDSDQKVQYLDYENTVNAITAAGIKYTIGE